MNHYALKWPFIADRTPRIIILDGYAYNKLENGAGLNCNIRLSFRRFVHLSVDLSFFWLVLVYVCMCLSVGFFYLKQNPKT